jgi:hypothetical protein
VRRFGVYRNNVVTGLVDALAARFPVTQALVGEEFFRAMARIHARQAPPRSPVMLHYGSAFPDFVAAFPPAAAVPYLADVARLEDARSRAYHAADVVPLGAAEFAAVTAEHLGDARVRMHPAAAILRSGHPVVSIWSAHQEQHPSAVAWEPEDALVTRPRLEVEVRRLRPGTAAFLAALAAGATVAKAADAGAHDSAAFDLAGAFAVLVESGAAAALR